MKPNREQIEQQKEKLRERIEDKGTDELIRRLAQVAEDTLRWATEDTEDWPEPVDDIDLFAKIIRDEQ